MKNVLATYKESFYKLIDETKYQTSQDEIEADIFYSDLFKRLDKVKKDKKRLFFIGNGASNAMASHFATDFTKNGGISSTAFTDGSLLSCFSNDYCFDDSYKEILDKQFIEGDGLVAISSSGNSKNIVNACSYVLSNHPDSLVLTLSGFKPDNKLRTNCTHNIYVSGATYGFVESAHSYLLHLIIDLYIDQQGNI